MNKKREYFISYCFKEKDGSYGFGSSNFDLTGRLTKDVMNGVMEKLKEASNFANVIILNIIELEY